MIASLLDALDERTGWRAIARAALDEPVRGGARFLYAFGSALVALIALQFVSGVVLAAHYSPSTTAAWASIVFIEERVILGRFVRGLHAWGASAIVIVLVLHYAQVVWLGAYRKPREVNWALGLALALVLLGLGFTGYLLPWDQKGYWATKVGCGIASATPIVGGPASRALMGGEDLGTLTLTRFYALHAIVLPWVLFALAAAHLYVFRRHGLTTPPSVAPDAPAARFFPSQTLKDAILIAAIAALLVAFVLKRGGADLEAPADPAGNYVARPEWYFLPLFQLLKYFPGPLEPIGSIAIPGVVFTLLLLLPKIDRAATTRASGRRLALAIAFAPIGGAVALGALATWLDASDPDLAARRDEAAREARLARRLAKDGVPPEGPLALLDHYPPRLGRLTFEARCASCHVVGDHGKAFGPALTGYLSPAWLARAIKTPNDPVLFGHGEFQEAMGATEATREELDALVAYVRSLEGAEAHLDAKLVARGKELFSSPEKSCSGCHEIAPGKSGDGPNLGGYGSAAWLKAFLVEPGAKHLYGAKNKMPAFRDKLSDEELDAVVLYLRSLASPPSDDDGE